jgi:hypothetical protein
MEETLKEIYYDPKQGLTSFNSFWKLIKKEKT